MSTAADDEAARRAQDDRWARGRRGHGEVPSGCGDDDDGAGRDHDLRLPDDGEPQLRPRVRCARARGARRRRPDRRACRTPTSTATPIAPYDAVAASSCASPAIRRTAGTRRTCSGTAARTTASSACTRPSTPGADRADAVPDARRSSRSPGRSPTRTPRCDRWFCSVMGPTLPNRAYWHAATSFGLKVNNDVLDDVLVGRPGADDLQPARRRGVDWAYYFGNLAVASLLGNPGPYALDLGPNDGTGHDPPVRRRARQRAASSSRTPPRARCRRSSTSIRRSARTTTTRRCIRSSVRS